MIEEWKPVAGDWGDLYEVSNLGRVRRNLAHGRNWLNIVCNTYSGEVSHFDWNGDEQEQPWEIAEAALARFQAAPTNGTEAK